MDLELLQSARQSLAAQQNFGAGSGTAWNHQMLDVSMRGLPGVGMQQVPQVVARQQPHDVNQGGGGYNQLNYNQNAMLVGTVAALQEESGQLRTQWKSDVSRLESELQQLRSAAAWALPHLQEAQNAEPSLRLVTTSAMDRHSSGNVHASQLENAMMQGALAERLNRERGLDAMLSQGASGNNHLSREAQLEAAMMQGAAAERASRERELEALLSARQGSVPEFGRQGAVPEFGGTMLSRENMQRNSSTGNIHNASSLAESVLSQHASAHGQRYAATASSCAESTCDGMQRGRPASSAAAEQPSAEQTKSQVLELYRELETITIALQEAQQENRELKEHKETTEMAHSRDVDTLEAMLQQVGADNERLTKSLAKAEEQLQKYSQGGLGHMLQVKSSTPSSNPASIRSASIEPASEPGSEQADFDRIRFKVGLNAHH